MLVFMGLQMFVWVVFRGVVYRLACIVFHLSRTWVQNGLLILKHRASVLRVSRARGVCGVGPSWSSRSFAHSSGEVCSLLSHEH